MQRNRRAYSSHKTPENAAARQSKPALHMPSCSTAAGRSAPQPPNRALKQNRPSKFHSFPPDPAPSGFLQTALSKLPRQERPNVYRYLTHVPNSSKQPLAWSPAAIGRVLGYACCSTKESTARQCWVRYTHLTSGIHIGMPHSSYCWKPLERPHCFDCYFNIPTSSNPVLF